jgi:hypothetical protein
MLLFSESIAHFTSCIAIFLRETDNERRTTAAHGH